MRPPAFIRIDDKPALGSRLTNGGEPLAVALATKLELEKRAVGGFRCGGRHRVGLIEAQRVGGHQRRRRGEAGKLPYRHSASLGFEIPQSTVKRIARRSRL